MIAIFKTLDGEEIARANAVEAVITRQLVRSVTSRVRVRSENGVGLMARLAPSILVGPLMMCLSDGASPLLPSFRLFDAAAVDPTCTMFCAVSDQTNGGLAHPGPRRWRVHTAARNVLDLIKSLRLATLPNSIANQLNLIGLGAPNEPAVLQNGLTDCQFLAYLLAETERLNPDKSTARLFPVGKTNGTWLIVASDPSHYLRTGAPGSQWSAKFEQSDGPETLYPATIGANETSENFDAGPSSARLGLYIDHSSRQFIAESFTAWMGQDLPLFQTSASGGSPRFVVGIQDTLHDVGLDTLVWHTRLLAGPNAGGISAPQDSVRVKAFAATAKVVDSDPTRPYLIAELDGFEPGFSKANVWLRPQTTGADGSGGPHFVPPVGAQIDVTSTGRLDAPLVCAGVRRTKPAAFAAPSLTLDQPFTVKLREMHVEHIGNVDVASPLNFKAPDTRIDLDSLDLGNSSAGIVIRSRVETRP